jgi:hypothetical protein
MSPQALDCPSLEFFDHDNDLSYGKNGLMQPIYAMMGSVSLTSPSGKLLQRILQAMVKSRVRFQRLPSSLKPGLDTESKKKLTRH